MEAEIYSVNILKTVKPLLGTTIFHSRDDQGSVRELTDSAGGIQAQYSFDPYGRCTKTQGSLRADFQYAGYYCHGPSGLNLTENRPYSTAMGRCLNRDPIEEIGGVNLYRYVRNAPIGHRDPTGLKDSSAPDPYWYDPGPYISPISCTASRCTFIADPGKDPSASKRKSKYPVLPDCKDTDCCTANFDDCTTRCDYAKRGRANIECHKCCGQRNLSCRAQAASGYPGNNWSPCWGDPWPEPPKQCNAK